MTPGQPPAVSVVIPVHNGERYLAEAIQSVLGQTFHDFDLVVVDDGSTDGTVDLVTGFGPPVRCCTQAKSGAGAARNHGVNRSSGDVVAFLDADDVWLPNKLEQQMNVFAREPGIEAVSGMVESFVSPELADRVKLSRHVAGSLPGAIPSAIAIRRTALARVGLFATNWTVGEFADWYMRAREASLRLHVLDSVVVRRRIHSDNQGVKNRRLVEEYARVAKASLDRRRARAAATDPDILPST